jgi:hypothetical protein
MRFHSEVRSTNNALNTGENTWDLTSKYCCIIGVMAAVPVIYAHRKLSGTRPLWPPSGPEGLHLSTQSGVYYSRYRLNGSRTFRSLKTRTFTVAKLKHAKRQLDVEKDRQRGAGIGSTFQTLGGLLVERNARLDAIDSLE